MSEDKVVEELRKQAEEKKAREFLNNMAGFVICLFMLFYFLVFMKPECDRNQQEMDKSLQEMEQQSKEFDSKWGENGTEWRR